MKRHYKSLIAIFAFIPVSLFGQTYTFTSAGVTGAVGPTQVQTDAEYAATNLNGQVTITTQGIQEWVVPATGNYTIASSGASGGTNAALSGYGALISGDVNLTAGTTLYILVGQMGSQFAPINVDGGGGGTFVTDGTDLLVAAGGGGGSAQGAQAGQNASLVNAVVNGAAGQFGSTGAGYSTNGIHFYFGVYTTVAQSFTNGGLGQLGGEAGGWPGPGYGDGGFGGGGSSCSCSTGSGGGGGGYNGGGGGPGTIGSTYESGFGGSSYTIASATNVSTSLLNSFGDGQVIITLNCTPVVGSLVADVATLSDVTEACLVTSLVAPTATNSCAGGLAATPDVTLPLSTVGNTVVTWTYFDGSNTITQTQNVIISGVDNDPPVLDNATLSDLGGQCSFTPPTPTATDVCTGTIQGVADVTFPYSGQGLTVITWTFDDGNGNTVTQTQNVNLNDVAPPNFDVATLTDYMGCGDATPPTPTATDFCTGAVNGVSDVTFPITAVGPTTVTWTYDDGNGNVSSQTQDVYVQPVDLGVTAAGTTITADVAGLSYQWIDCNTGLAIAGATGQSYTPTITGDYAVEITDGMCVDTSACTLVDFTSIDELALELNAYPNPTTGALNVELDGSFEVIVYTTTGQIILADSGSDELQIDISKFENGTYFLKVMTESKAITLPLIKQ